MDPTLQEIAKQVGKSTAQVVLRWNIQGGLGICGKSVFENELGELDLFYSTLKTLKSLNGTLTVISHISQQLFQIQILKSSTSSYQKIKWKQSMDWTWMKENLFQLLRSQMDPKHHVMENIFTTHIMKNIEIRKNKLEFPLGAFSFFAQIWQYLYF